MLFSRPHVFRLITFQSFNYISLWTVIIGRLRKQMEVYCSNFEKLKKGQQEMMCKSNSSVINHPAPEKRVATFRVLLLKLTDYKTFVFWKTLQLLYPNAFFFFFC